MALTDFQNDTPGCSPAGSVPAAGRCSPRPGEDDTPIGDPPDEDWDDDDEDDGDDDDEDDDDGFDDE